MSDPSPWGPFRPGLPPDEQKARLRALRLAVKLLTGERGRDAAFAILRAELGAGDPELLAQAEAAVDRLGTRDLRRVLSGYRKVA